MLKCLISTVIFGVLVCVGSSFAQMPGPVDDRPMVPVPRMYNYEPPTAPPNAPRAMVPPNLRDGQGFLEKWEHRVEVLPPRQYEDHRYAEEYNRSNYRKPEYSSRDSSDGWYFNRTTGCWERDLPASQYVQPNYCPQQPNYYVPRTYCPQQYYYTYPQRQYNSCWW